MLWAWVFISVWCGRSGITCSSASTDSLMFCWAQCWIVWRASECGVRYFFCILVVLLSPKVVNQLRFSIACFHCRAFTAIDSARNGIHNPPLLFVENLFVENAFDHVQFLLFKNSLFISDPGDNIVVLAWAISIISCCERDLDCTGVCFAWHTAFTWDQCMHQNSSFDFRITECFWFFSPMGICTFPNIIVVMMILEVQEHRARLQNIAADHKSWVLHHGPPFDTSLPSLNDPAATDPRSLWCGFCLVAAPAPNFTKRYHQKNKPLTLRL